MTFLRKRNSLVKVIFSYFRMNKKYIYNILYTFQQTYNYLNFLRMPCGFFKM